MPKKLSKILAVNPLSRCLGIAYFHGHALREWQVKNIRSTDSKTAARKAEAFLSWFIDYYKIDVLVLKKLHSSRSSQRVDLLASQIKTLAREKNLAIYEYSIGELEAFLCEGNRANKLNLAQAVTCKHPGLLYEFRKEQYNKQPYYMSMFEAVALGQLCVNQLEKQ